MGGRGLSVGRVATPRLAITSRVSLKEMKETGPTAYFRFKRVAVELDMLSFELLLYRILGRW